MTRTAPAQLVESETEKSSPPVDLAWGMLKALRRALVPDFAAARRDNGDADAAEASNTALARVAVNFIFKILKGQRWWRTKFEGRLRGGDDV